MNISKADLLPAVERLRRILPTRATIPVLSCFRLEGVGKLLRIRASSIDTDLEVEVPCSGELEPTVVSGRLFSELCLRSEGDEVDLVRQNGSLLFESDGSKAKLQVADPKDFPAPVEGSFQDLGMDKEDLAACTSSVLFALDSTPSSDATWWKHCLHVRTGGQGALAECGSAYLFARSTVPTIAGNAEICVQKAIGGVLSSFLTTDKAVLGLGERRGRLKGEGFCLYFSLCADKYPDLNRAFNAEMEVLGELEPDRALVAVNNCVAMMDDNIHTAVNLDWGSDGLSLEYQGAANNYRCGVGGSFTQSKQRFGLALLRSALKAFSGKPSVSIKAFDGAGRGVKGSVMLECDGLKVMLAEMRRD